MASPAALELKVKIRKYFCPQNRCVADVMNIRVARLLFGCNTCTICDGCKEIEGED